MQKWITALVAIALGAGPALAQVDVDMAFNPGEARFAQVVTLSGTVKNLGGTREDVTLSLLIEQSPVTVGPIEITFSLAAGDRERVELPYVTLFPGRLVLTLTATSGAFSDTAVATLETRGFGAPPNAEILRFFGELLLERLSSDPVSVDASSWGAIKALYR